ncbi:40S small subunit processome assembly factor 1 isoform X2 [Brachyhypopomus gauderio]|uniref:40S small subunit processome assembly factor 1 isoform X2 n=1 Tax=Brachyhypopomus gauderio TaxID=698409 RepID=UPI004043320F
MFSRGKGGQDRQSQKHKKRKSKGHDELDENTGVVKADSGHLTVDTVPESGAPHTDPQNPAPAPKQSNVEIVTFLDPLKKNTLKKAPKPESKPSEVKKKDHKKKDPHEVLSIEQARLDVHRFGITGFQKQEQRVFEQERAIMLGARPPKKEYVNYKVYQKMVKEKRLKEKEEAKSHTQRKKKKKSGRQRTERHKTAPSGRELTGLRGRFKDGVLMVNTSDIQKMNRKRRK